MSESDTEMRNHVRLKVASAMLEYVPLDKALKFSDRVKHLSRISEEVTEEILALFSRQPADTGECEPDWFEMKRLASQIVNELTPDQGHSASSTFALAARLQGMISAASAGEDREACSVCDVEFRPGDLCATDIDLGTCHAACLDGSPVVNLETGEPFDGPAFVFVWGSDEAMPIPSESPAQ